MFRQRAFEGSVIASTGALLLLVLPLSGKCQSDAVQTKEPSEPIEEVIVRGHKSIIDLKHEMYRAEDALYGLYNSLNTDDDFDTRCYEEAPTGSKIPRRVCRANFYGKLLAELTQRRMRGEPITNPVFEIRRMNERRLADMTEKALEHSELLKAIVRYSETKQTLESERKRRCEGRLFICRRE